MHKIKQNIYAVYSKLLKLFCRPKFAVFNRTEKRQVNNFKFFIKKKNIKETNVQKYNR